MVCAFFSPAPHVLRCVHGYAAAEAATAANTAAATSTRTHTHFPPGPARQVNGPSVPCSLQSTQRHARSSSPAADYNALWSSAQSCADGIEQEGTASLPRVPGRRHSSLGTTAQFGRAPAHEKRITPPASEVAELLQKVLQHHSLAVLNFLLTAVCLWLVPVLKAGAEEVIL